MNMHTYSRATCKSIERYRKSELGAQVCGNKPFGSRHWEYPWAVEQSDILNGKGLKILDVAPDFTFPYARFLEKLGHEVTYIDLERRPWSDKVVWGLDPKRLKENFHIMDVRQMSFPDHYFDCIFCISVLEHLVCPTQNPDHPKLREFFEPLAARPAIAEMKRCLKPGGRLMITIDIYGGPKWRPFFEQWDICGDIAASGFAVGRNFHFDRNELFSNPETYISRFFGPYITLGFRLVNA